MNQESNTNLSISDSVLQNTAQEIWELAARNQHDTLFLLSLLRSLEAIHRAIRTEMFELSLPETRNNLYHLVKDIEEKGGWPYIERMKLRELLKNLKSESQNEQPDAIDLSD